MERTSLWEELELRGLVYQASDPALGERLSSEQLCAYTGFDPTAPSLHVGHLLPILNLARLQRWGHRPIVLAGGGTGMIGDPSGRSDERQLLDGDQLQDNLAGIRSQLGSLLDFSEATGGAGAVMVDNSEWLSGIGTLEFLRDVGKHFGVGQMISKESVRSRLEGREHGISFTEFSYMLLQAYDYLHLFDTYGCRVQMGASDQWGNITMGIDLIRKVRRQEVFGLTTPLLVGPDGEKFGKTAGGAVWLDPALTSPYAFYQFFFNTEDAVVGKYLRYFTFLGIGEITALDEKVKDRPEEREAQRTLARLVTETVHGAEATSSAEHAAKVLFSAEVDQLDEKTLLEVFADSPSTAFARSRLETASLSAVDLLVETGMEPSKGAARRTLAQGGAYLNNRRIEEPDDPVGYDRLIAGRYLVLRRGKRSSHLASFD